MGAAPTSTPHSRIVKAGASENPMILRKRMNLVPNGQNRRKDGVMGLNVGDKAPNFSVAGDRGGIVDLAALKGRKVVLYFYPKADTPGCTQEAKDFTALKAAFEAAGTTVIGMSRDPAKALDKFQAKHGLGVALGSDEDGQVVEAYGVWVEKSMYGKSYMGIERATFLIDAEGKIAHIWPKVKVKDHAAEVLAAAQAL
jgi:peroxiredoxin Q/BCP